MPTNNTTPPVHGHRVTSGKTGATAENTIVQAGQPVVIQTTLPSRAFSGTIPAGHVPIVRKGVIIGTRNA